MAKAKKNPFGSTHRGLARDDIERGKQQIRNGRPDLAYASFALARREAQHARDEKLMVTAMKLRDQALNGIGIAEARMAERRAQYNYPPGQRPAGNPKKNPKKKTSTKRISVGRLVANALK